jgi:hypothetical protein
MEAVRSSERMANIYQTTWRLIPEDSTLQVNLKLRNYGHQRMSFLVTVQKKCIQHNITRIITYTQGHLLLHFCGNV